MTWGSIIAILLAVVLYFLSEHHRLRANKLAAERDASNRALALMLVSQKAVDKIRAANDLEALRKWLDRQDEPA